MIKNKINIDQIEIVYFKSYLVANGWNVNHDDENLIKLSKNEFEIIIPNSERLKDYNNLILSAIEEFAKIENRSVERVYNDLITPRTDIIRFRMDSSNTSNGTISLDKARKLHIKRFDTERDKIKGELKNER